MTPESTLHPGTPGGRRAVRPTRSACRGAPTRSLLGVVLAGLAAMGCEGPPPPPAGAGRDAPAPPAPEWPPEALRSARALSDSVEALLLPVPLLTPGEEAALRSASNAAQLARARELATRVTDSLTLERLVGEGALVPLEDTTALWATRELRSSVPLVTPDARALLVEIGERFQARLRGMGLPAYRVEVTSVLRTPAAQAALRQTNPNAAAGVSTHEFGTTLDLAYSGYTAPGEAPPAANAAPPDDAPDRLADALTALALERVAARYSRELQKVLGDVLLEMQREGFLMVTLERQQPVFHLTVARARAPAP